MFYVIVQDDKNLFLSPYMGTQNDNKLQVISKMDMLIDDFYYSTTTLKFQTFAILHDYLQKYLSSLHVLYGPTSEITSIT